MSVKTNALASASDAPSGESRSEIRSLSDTELFHLLQTSRRRETIRYLLKRDGPVRMTDLVEHVAAEENETRVPEVTQDQYQRVYIPLYQSHLPKLDESGVIEYDKSRGVVRSTDRLEAFRPYVGSASDGRSSARPTADFDADSDSAGSRPASDWYITAAGLSGLLLIIVVLELVSLPGVALGGIIITAFLVANAAATR